MLKENIMHTKHIEGVVTTVYPPCKVMSHGIEDSILRTLTKTNDLGLPLYLIGQEYLSIRASFTLFLIQKLQAMMQTTSCTHIYIYGRPSQWNGWEHLDNLTKMKSKTSNGINSILIIDKVHISTKHHLVENVSLSRKWQHLYQRVTICIIA